MKREILFKEGDRVWTYDVEFGKGYVKVYGTFIKNEYKNVSDWAVNWDDGECCAVLDLEQLYKD